MTCWRQNYLVTMACGHDRVYSEEQVRLLVIGGKVAKRMGAAAGYCRTCCCDQKATAIEALTQRGVLA